MASDLNRPLTIMPLGDSITQGVVNYADLYSGGYRTKLWNSLVDDSRNVDFVGTRSNGPSTLGDKDHNGLSGRSIDYLTGQVDYLFSVTKPDVVLLMIGTNDTRTDTLSEMISQLRTLLLKITAYSPDSLILVSTIPPTQDHVRNHLVDAYNDAIPHIVAQFANAGRKVSFVDMTDLTTGDISSVNDSGLHPTAAGYQKIADHWYNALGTANVFGDNCKVIGGDRADTLAGSTGFDILSAGAGDDVLRGGRGGDRVYGGTGADTIIGGQGADLLEGGDGNDRVSGGTEADLIIGALGSDALWGDLGNDRIDGGDGSDAISGGLGDDIVKGGEGQDRVDGGDGADAIAGGIGDDILRGGDGNDRMDGGAGTDTLLGELGRDVLKGGEGRDTFYFTGEGAAAGDILIDYAPGEDRLVFAGYGPGAHLTSLGDGQFSIVNRAGTAETFVIATATDLSHLTYLIT